MIIAYTSAQTGQITIAKVGPGVTPERAAAAMNLAPGTWRVITPEEAAELQKPTAEEVAEARRKEIKAALEALDDLYLPRRVLAGLALKDPYAEEQWAKHEAEAAPLRAELAGLAAAEGGPEEMEVEA